MGLTLLMSSLAEVGTPSEEKMTAGELTGVPCFPPSYPPPLCWCRSPIGQPGHVTLLPAESFVAMWPTFAALPSPLGR